MLVPKPVVLAGKYVRLVPVRLEHAGGLFQALSLDRSLWDLRPEKTPETEAEMRQLVRIEIERQNAGQLLVFTQIDFGSGKIAGSTSYSLISTKTQTLEIGRTWIAKPWQRTGINTEAKFLLLRHAFEELGSERVQFRADTRNLRSQAAIERLGAVKEGVLRKDLPIKQSYRRDTVIYSILAEEWPAVRRRLSVKLKISL